MNKYGLRYGIALGLVAATLAWAGPFNPANLPTRYSSGASLVSSGVVIASSARLVGCSGYNDNAAAQYFHLYDSATVPANGTAVDIQVRVPAESNFSYAPPERGSWFGAGISWAQSTTAASKTLAGTTDFFVVCHYDAR